MSQQLIARSPDLRQLRNEGYDIAIVRGYLIVRDVPYVNSTASVQHGVLISPLDLAGDKTTKPASHVAYWVGEHPCHANGNKLSEIENSSAPPAIGEGIQANFTFSAKANYRDYHHKVTTYIGRITGEASVLDPTATAQTFPAIPEDSGDGIFKYVDTASSRANINALNERLAGQHIGIVGLGGTGTYILDLVAKTWVAEIHLIDGDIFSQHNAFRSPGAPTIEQLEAKPPKVTHHAQVYSKMRNGIEIHNEFLGESNLALLDSLDFVFLCLDQEAEKRIIVEQLVSQEIPFVDAGMGIVVTHREQLIGIVRSVISTPENRDKADGQISYDDSNDDEYSTNIQIAELNALNAALAVIQWKKYYGVYFDADSPCYAGYSIASGEFASEGQNEAADAVTN